MFFEKGYPTVSPNVIAKTLNISTGNLTYYYPTKEHLLAILMDDLCRIQWKIIKEVVEDGKVDYDDLNTSTSMYPPFFVGEK